jgi:CRISPR system Cascade subunit CasE
MTLNMIQLTIAPARLYEWARQSGMTLHDRGYLAHCAMRLAFGDAAPQPFALLDDARPARTMTILGYGAADADQLRANHAMYTQPLLARALPARSIADKPMPDAWATGQTLGFRVRCCPIVRRKNDGRTIEKDAFLAACDKAPDDEVDRGQVYADWLARQFDRDSAARIRTVDMRSFRMVKPVRRKKPGALPRQLGGLRPETILDGVLEIADPDAFSRLLARGVGRHRAFGYGMVLLRPA